ncbi:MAG: NUDIX domain-containing protein [Spirochaetaceae bacterium]
MSAIFYYKNPTAPIPNLPPLLGCVALIVKDQKYLVEHRVDSDRWAFIGGGLESNEDFKDCVIRETLEETGLEAVQCEMFKTLSNPTSIIEYSDGNSRRVITIVFNVHIKDFSKLKCSEESRELKFISKAELLNIHIAETHIPIIEAIMQ